VISPAATNTKHSSRDSAVQALVRYGSIPLVARYVLQVEVSDSVTRGSEIIIRTDRGLEFGHVLEVLPPSVVDEADISTTIVRTATDQDRKTYQKRQHQSAEDFEAWQQRIHDWKLELEVIDLERTLDDDKVILYVLNDQNAETTRLALLAAAAGLGIIHVQPVAAEGIVNGSDGGCGSGCGCGH
jgi:hypothetical protein